MTAPGRYTAGDFLPCGMVTFMLVSLQSRFSIFRFFVPDPEKFQLTKSNTCFIVKHEQMFHIEKEILYGKGRKIKST